MSAEIIGWPGDDREPGPSTALVVDEVRIVMTDPPRYEVVVDGVVVPCSLQDMMSRTLFQGRCLAVLHRIPDVPSGKGAIQAWQAIVNRWLIEAVRIAAPAEASPRAYQRQAVADTIAGMVVVTADDDGAASDFRRGCAVYRGGRVFVRLPSLLGRLRPEHPKMGPDDLADHLRILGWIACRIRLSGAEAVSAWYADRTVWSQIQAWLPQVAELDPENG